ncbi:MAG: hypothetical protein JW850_07450 [Thermoflexales bacterium]|nr:hypothetical protein [Thermoflexales bacterium]
MREHEWIKGRWRDTLVYGLIRSEWRELCSHSFQEIVCCQVSLFQNMR